MANLRFIQLGRTFNSCGFTAILLFITVGFTACSNKIHRTFIRDAPLQADAKLSPSCTDYVNYAPDLNFPSHSPMRYVRLNFHIMKDSTGTINFDEQTGAEFVKGLIADANQRLSINPQMSLPEGNNTPALPKRFQFVLTPDPAIAGDDGIYFHY